MTKFVDDKDGNERARDHSARMKILRGAAELIDEAKMIDDPAPLATDTGKLLFSGLLHMTVDTDAVQKLFHDKPNADDVSPAEFFRACRPSASVRDGIAHAAMLLGREASEFWQAKRPGETWGVSFDQASAVWAERGQRRSNEQS
jgi:hypothetical protein